MLGHQNKRKSGQTKQDVKVGHTHLKNQEFLNISTWFLGPASKLKQKVEEVIHSHSNYFQGVPHSCLKLSGSLGGEKDTYTILV